ncbi:hok/gef family protein [Klebsiella pneumoniae]|nr:hok/gef family protein [Klebsiella pneumoniae]WRP88500.1 hok/gef family protein [Klebsiella pneumoniae]
MFNALDIHMPDPEPLMRSPAKGRNREVAASLAYESNGK